MISIPSGEASDAKMKKISLPDMDHPVQPLQSFSLDAFTKDNSCMDKIYANIGHFACPNLQKIKE